jgi:hypothetical protein
MRLTLLSPWFVASELQPEFSSIAACPSGRFGCGEAFTDPVVKYDLWSPFLFGLWAPELVVDQIIRGVFRQPKFNEHIVVIFTNPSNYWWVFVYFKQYRKLAQARALFHIRITLAKSHSVSFRGLWGGFHRPVELLAVGRNAGV